MNEVLDVKRMFCPMPIIKTQQKAVTMKSGDILTIECTDSGVLHDIPAWSRLQGHKVLRVNRLKDGLIFIVIKVKHSKLVL